MMQQFKKLTVNDFVLTDIEVDNTLTYSQLFDARTLVIQHFNNTLEKFDKIMDNMEDNRLADEIEEEINGKI
jgi:ABC-type lipoprotein release transport system permease subunit